MKIQYMTTVPGETWQTLIKASDDTWLYHTQAWLDLTTQVWPFENHYFVAEHNGRYVGALPIQIIRRRRLRKACHHAFSLPMGSAGPFCVRDLSISKRQRVMNLLMQALTNWATQEKVALLGCSLPPLAHKNLKNEHGVNPLVLAGWQDVSTHTRIVNLNKTEDELWSDLSYDARRSVRASRSAGYSVEMVRWEAFVDEYYRVHRETYGRTGAIPHPRAYFEKIASLIAPDGHAVLWVGREPGGRAVAFHNDACYGDGCLYWTGCCETAHLQSGINYLLFWHALVGARQEGYKWYEIGESFPGEMDGKLKGLTTFKAKFGGELYRYYRGEIRMFEDPVPVFLRNSNSSAYKFLQLLNHRYKGVRNT